jgi:hypothetical protein
MSVCGVPELDGAKFRTKCLNEIQDLRFHVSDNARAKPKLNLFNLVHLAVSNGTPSADISARADAFGTILPVWESGAYNPGVYDMERGFDRFPTPYDPWAISSRGEMKQCLMSADSFRLLRSRHF